MGALMTWNHAAAEADRYRTACGLEGVFARGGLGVTDIVLRVSAAISVVAIPEELSLRILARLGRAAMGQIVGVPDACYFWLARPASGFDPDAVAPTLSILDTEILPNGSEIALPGPPSDTVAGRWWVSGVPADSYRMSVAAVVAHVLDSGRGR